MTRGPIAIAIASVIGGCGERPRPAASPEPVSPPATTADAAPASGPVDCSESPKLGAWKPLGDPTTADTLCAAARAEDENVSDCDVSTDPANGVAVLSTEALGQTMEAVYAIRGAKLHDIDFGTYSSGRGYSESLSEIRAETIGGRAVLFITALRSDDMRDSDGEGAYEELPVQSVCVVEESRGRCLINDSSGITLSVDSSGTARWKSATGAPLDQCLSMPIALW